MIKETFNLVDEAWIRALCQDYRLEELSLRELLLRAHEFRDLAGEMATQDMAMLRLLLAILHSIFAKINLEGNEEPLNSGDMAFERWKELWKLGHFPETPINSYLTKWHDRFWLFHETRPFWQVPSAVQGTAYGAAKLNGVLSESSNKIRLFPAIAGPAKQSLSYAEAARWLLHVNGFDDTSAKPKGKNLPSPGAGWLGKIGLLAAVGKNLFETLLLNLVLVDEKSGAPWEAGKAIWEREKLPAGERVEISLPHNQAELLTLQSRRLLLRREGERVVGFNLLGGDFFEREGATAEQMTVWVKPKEEGGRQKEMDTPRRHQPERQMWRDFANYFDCSGQDENAKQRLPGVVSWYKSLVEKKCLPYEQMIRFRTAFVHYGDKDFFVDDASSDSLCLSAQLLLQAGDIWRERIHQEVVKCDALAREFKQYAKELTIADGGDNQAYPPEAVAGDFYFRLDQPFRQWLESLKPDGEENYQAAMQRWESTARDIAFDMAEELLKQTGPKAFRGRIITYKDKAGREQDSHFCSVRAYLKIRQKIKKHYNLEGGEAS